MFDEYDKSPLGWPLTIIDSFIVGLFVLTGTLGSWLLISLLFTFGGN